MEPALTINQFIKDHESVFGKSGVWASDGVKTFERGWKPIEGDYQSPNWKRIDEDVRMRELREQQDRNAK